MAPAAGFTFMGLLKAVAIGAAVGAVVGGLTAAITGGDIAKGVLYGAAGGAVSGALVYGVGAIMGPIAGGGGATTTTASVLEGGGSGAAMGTGGGSFQIAGTNAVGSGATGAAGGGSWLSSLWTDIKGGFSSGGEAGGAAFGQQAAGSAINALAGTYNQKKQAEAAEDQLHTAAELAEQKAQADHERAKELLAINGGGGGGGGASFRPLSDELAMIDAQAAAAERKVNAELEGQKALRQQERDYLSADREMMASAGTALSAGLGTASSRSTETLADIQDRIRAGEGPGGIPNTAIVPSVEYIPPEEQAVG